MYGKIGGGLGLEFIYKDSSNVKSQRLSESALVSQEGSEKHEY